MISVAARGYFRSGISQSQGVLYHISICTNTFIECNNLSILMTWGSYRLTQGLAILSAGERKGIHYVAWL